MRGELGLVRGELDEMRADNERTIAATIAETRDEVLALAAAATEKLAAREGALRTEIKKLEQAAVVRTQLQEEAVGRLRGEVEEAAARRLSAQGHQKAAEEKVAPLEAAREAAEAAMEESEAARIAAVEARELQIDELEQRAETVRQLEDEVQTLKGNVKVFARVRPMKPAEEHACGAAVSVAAAKDGIPRRLLVTHAAQGVGAEAAAASARPFDFDRVFGADVNTETLFAELKPMVTRVAGGAKATVLAYGQTGSGKTFTSSAIHTMAGAELLNLGCTVSFAALEVYNERAVDLLSTSARNKLEHHLDGLTWHALDSADAAQSLAEAAAARRATADNGLNAVSSRSHLVFLYRASTTCGVDAVKSGQGDGQLALVDLAGSERLKRTEAVGERREEAVQINKSLSAIGDVVAALAKGTQHVPYRNAKLTHILQPYLERGCRVAMLVMASPAVADAAETANALTFGVRARSVTLGQARDAAGGTATARAHEVTRLKRLLLESRQAAVAHERAADEERAKLAAAEEKMEKAAEAAKAAEARAKAAEAGVSKEDAAAAKEKAALQKEVGELKRKLAAALARAERPTPTKHATPTSAAGAAGTPRSTPRAAPDLSSLGPPPTMPPPPTPPVALAGAPPPPVLAGARPVEVWVDEAGVAAEAPPSSTKKRKGSRSSKRSSPGATGGGFGDDTADENERTIAAAVADATAALLPLRDRNSVMPPTPSPRKTTPRKQNSFDTLADTLVSIAATPPPASLASSSSLSAVKEVRVLRSAARTPGNRPVTAPASSSKGLSAKPRRVAQTPKATPKAPPGRVTRQTPGASRTPASSRKAGRLEQPRWN